MITIINYQAGNVASVAKAFKYLGAVTEVTSDPDVVAMASKLVLPGVGHFAATAILESSGIRQAVEQAVAGGVPFLGICVGMQWLFEGSEEAPEAQGMGVFRGRCQRFPASVKVPHVGWNQVRGGNRSELLAGLDNDFFVYYTHSYRAPSGEATVACTDYGGAFSAVVEQKKVFGVQFHPEKSGAAGLRLLENFVKVPC